MLGALATDAVVCGETSARSSRSISSSAIARSCGRRARDPPLFMFVPEATERLRGPARRPRGGGARGGPAAGVTGVAGRASRRSRARARPRAAHRAFFSDYAGLASWPVTCRELRSMDVPAVVVTGPSSPPHVVAAADALAGLMPAARRADDGDLVAAARTLSRRPEHASRASRAPGLVAGSVKARRRPSPCSPCCSRWLRCRRAAPAAPAPIAAAPPSSRRGPRSSSRCRSRPG